MLIAIANMYSMYFLSIAAVNLLRQKYYDFNFSKVKAEQLTLIWFQKTR